MRTWSLSSPEMSLRNRLGKKRKILAAPLKKFLRTPLPLYLALPLAINVGVLTAAGGYTTSITWGDIGKSFTVSRLRAKEHIERSSGGIASGPVSLDILKGGS